jgi:prepilin-type N-terminal cleavage/methylation domain-containing protein
MNINSKKDQRGFTLLEVLVTVMVFSLMTILISSILGRAIFLQRRLIAAEKIQENATFAMETMAKEIRVSTIIDQESPDCTATTLAMAHPIYGNIVYSLVSGNIQKQVGGASGVVNSSEVQFDRMNFCITGSGGADQQSPKITILFSISNTKGQKITINTQSTITSRDISSELQQ